MKMAKTDFRGKKLPTGYLSNIVLNRKQFDRVVGFKNVAMQSFFDNKYARPASVSAPKIPKEPIRIPLEKPSA